MKRIAPILALCLCSLLTIPSVAARAGDDPCTGLSPAQGKLVEELLATQYPYACCDDTIARCLQQESPCPLAVRLKREVCRLAGQGKTREEIEHALLRRAQTMVADAPPATILLDPRFLAGEPNAPVVVAVYACTRCPFCSKLLPPLYQAVTDGALRGKVRLYFRPFPLKEHPGSVEGGQALIAAALQGQAWAYLLKLYAQFDDFAPCKLGDWAEALGLDRAQFTAAFQEQTTRDYLVEAKREGLRNHIEATPTLFINGRKYLYELSQEAVQDILEEECESATHGQP